MSGHIPRENHNSKRYMHPNVYSSTVFTARTWKQPKCLSTDEQIKMWTSSFKRKIVLMVESVHNMVPEVSPYLRI